MKMLNAIVVILILALFSVVVFADPDPSGPANIDRGASERRTADSNDGIVEPSTAGNVTSLNINSTEITKRWQGYYGNVSGLITLDDANNNTLYNWQLASSDGEVYASNGSSVTWSNIQCLNFTADESSAEGYRYNLSSANNLIGLGSDSEQAKEDSVNATFNLTYGDAGSGTTDETFEVGSVTIDNAANCSMANLFNSNGWQSSSFHEVLLTDNESIIFASLLENSVAGFQNIGIGFEMIVGVNGTDSTTTDNYYFFVELT